MKKILLLVGLIALAKTAAAQTNDLIVHEVGVSTRSVVRTVSVCATVLDVTNATSSGTVAGAFSIEIYNIAASTNTINCGYDASVSTDSTSANYGREIVAGQGVVWQVELPNRLPRCLSQNSSGCTRTTITQIK